ncbi:hypothetical protein Ndes2526B_g06005 [Nannochloris sp. 'desiccata']|nr:hypothetical protein NADE_005902 [Chlorella desiccata (nom. nud.)]
MGTEKTAYNCLLLVVFVLAAQIQPNSASSEAFHQRRSLLTREHIRSAQQKACIGFCDVNPQITDSVTQRRCNPVCLRAIALKTTVEVSEAAAATVAEEDPFVVLGVAPASLCPDFCKGINATSIEDCNTSCITFSSTLSAFDGGTDPAVSGSLPLTYACFTTCAALFIALLSLNIDY